MRASEELGFLRTGIIERGDFFPYWANYNDRGSFGYVIEYDVLKKLEEDFRKLKVKSEFSQNEVVYIGRNSTTPRFKLKEFFIQKNLTKTKLPLNATSVLLNKKGVDDFFNSPKIWLALPLPKQLIMDTAIKSNYVFRTSAKAEDAPKWNKSHFENVDIFIMKYKISGSNHTQIFNTFGLNTVNPGKPQKYYIISGWGKDKEKQLFDNLFDIVQNPNLSVVYDEETIEEVHEQGAKIGEDLFEMANSLLESGDADNVKLAMNLLANSNYKESLLNVLMILNANRMVFYKKKNKFTDNIRSFLKYLSNRNLAWNTYWSYAVATWTSSKLFENQKPEIEKYIKENIIRDIKINSQGLIKITDLNVEF
jgi:hypothetical protein